MMTMPDATPEIPNASAADLDRIARGRDIVMREVAGLERLADVIGSTTLAAVDLIRRQPGRVIVTGMGKSGHIGAKLAATLASTGTPSFFVHAAEAAHGDLGMILKGDAVLAISISGSSRELFPVIDYCAANDVPLIAMCGAPESRLGKAASVLLPLPEIEEVCPNNLAPTTSATVTLVLGHVLAVLLMEERAFLDTDFAAFHPGGRLGLLMQTVQRYIDEFGVDIPSVALDAPMDKVISEMASGRKGCVVVMAADKRNLAGIITEGDLRRAYAPDMFTRSAQDIMTVNPATVRLDDLMRDVVAVLKARRIAHVVVVREDAVIDVLHVKDIMQNGYI